MSELRFKTAKYYEVDYGDLEEFIKKVYGQRYDIPCGEETGNDTTIRERVKKKPLDDWDSKQLENFKAGKECSYTLGAIMNDLCIQGYIPAGEWLIKVCW